MYLGASLPSATPDRRHWHCGLGQIYLHPHVTDDRAPAVAETGLFITERHSVVLWGSIVVSVAICNDCAVWEALRSYSWILEEAFKASAL